MNFYAVLGVPRDADDETIRRAYRILARRYHPDSGPGSSAERFRQANEAYATLIDPGRRQTYDLSQSRVPVEAEPISQSGPYPMEDAAVFGVSSRPQTVVFPTISSDELFERWLRSFGDFFSGPSWPW